RLVATKSRNGKFCLVAQTFLSVPGDVSHRQECLCHKTASHHARSIRRILFVAATGLENCRANQEAAARPSCGPDHYQDLRRNRTWPGNEGFGLILSALSQPKNVMSKNSNVPD